MKSNELALRKMLSSIQETNTIGPKPSEPKKLPMYTPRTPFSYAMELIVKHGLASKQDGSDIRIYTDSVRLTPFGKTYLSHLNRQFLHGHLF